MRLKLGLMQDGSSGLLLFSYMYKILYNYYIINIIKYIMLCNVFIGTQTVVFFLMILTYVVKKKKLSLDHF